MHEAAKRMTGILLQMHLVHQTQKYHAITDALEDPTGLAVLGIFATVSIQKEIISQLTNTVVLSSKKNVFKDKLTKY